MKKAVHHKIGNPAQVLVLEEIAPVALKAGEVRIAVLAAPIHPSNLLQISGHYGVLPVLPAIPGSEGVGRVTEVGAGVTHLAAGQVVMITTGQTWQQEIVGPAAAFIPLPPQGDVLQMSMITQNPLTAHLILQDYVDLKPGDWIAQNAANSAVGGYIIQMAKLRGVKTVNVVRREDVAPSLKAMGADVVITEGPDLPARIAAATDNAKIVFAIDAVSGPSAAGLAQSLTFGGTLVNYGALSMQPMPISARELVFNDVRVRGFWLAQWFKVATPEMKQAAFGPVIGMVAKGAISALVDATYNLDQIHDAVVAAAKEGRNGKIILTPNPA